MHVKFFTLLVVFFALSSIGWAQPPCNFGSNVGCAWGHLYDGTGANQFDPASHPINHGPIDICHGNDPSCSNPIQSVCETNNGAWFFAFGIGTSYVIKPRVVGSHASWFPSSQSFFASSQGYSSATLVDFVLTSFDPTGQCSF